MSSKKTNKNEIAARLLRMMVGDEFRVQDNKTRIKALRASQILEEAGLLSVAIKTFKRDDAYVVLAVRK